MATSPPQYTRSPTLPSLTLPKKRPSITAPAGTTAKRRKPSSASTSTHPLRQTSFPPEANGSAAVSPSPSVESSHAGGSTAGAQPAGRKRGRPAGSGKGDASSLAGGRAGSVGGTAAGSLKAGEGGNEDADEEEDEGGAVDTVMEGVGKMDEAAMKQEKEHLSMLMDAFDPDQTERYDIWRRVRLKKETVRRITNQTLSQSVPASVVTTVNGYTKIFIGELIERARDVQTQWMAAADKLPTGRVIGPDTPLQERILERDRGPLTPDHIREALRRYKKDKEGGCAGFIGLSLEGRENTAARMGGRRLFR